MTGSLSRKQDWYCATHHRDIDEKCDCQCDLRLKTKRGNSS